MAPTLYVKYGSRLTSGMAECFYDRVLVDPDLAPFFDRLMVHVAAAAEELEIEPEDIATVADAIIGLKDQVVTA